MDEHKVVFSKCSETFLVRYTCVDMSSTYVSYCHVPERFDESDKNKSFAVSKLYVRTVSPHVYYLGHTGAYRIISIYRFSRSTRGSKSTSQNCFTRAKLLPLLFVSFFCFLFQLFFFPLHRYSLLCFYRESSLYPRSLLSSLNFVTSFPSRFSFVSWRSYHGTCHLF